MYVKYLQITLLIAHVVHHQWFQQEAGKKYENFFLLELEKLLWTI